MMTVSSSSNATKTFRNSKTSINMIFLYKITNLRRFFCPINKPPILEKASSENENIKNSNDVLGCVYDRE
jgi:hypothetical protein